MVVIVTLSVGSLTLTSCQSQRNHPASANLMQSVNGVSNMSGTTASSNSSILALNYSFTGDYFPQFEYILNRTKDYSRPYSVVIFKHLQTNATSEKNFNFCQSLSASYPFSNSNNEYAKKEIYWPVKDKEIQYLFRNNESHFNCQYALEKYDLWQSQLALIDARNSGLNLSGHGPYIVTWANAFDRGQEDVPILLADFSNVQTSEQALEILGMWHSKASKPALEWKTEQSSIETWMQIKYRFENFFLPLERKF